MGPGVLETLPGLAALRWPGSKALLARFRAVECRRSVADSLGPTALAHNPAANGREAHLPATIARGLALANPRLGRFTSNDGMSTAQRIRTDPFSEWPT